MSMKYWFGVSIWLSTRRLGLSRATSFWAPPASPSHGPFLCDVALKLQLAGTPKSSAWWTIHSFCQAQPQLNFIFNVEAEIALFSDNTATHPTGKVVKWNNTSNTSIEDFKYFNWWVQILASLNSISTSVQPQLNSISAQLNLNSNYWAWHYSAKACLCFSLRLNAYTHAMFHCHSKHSYAGPEVLHFKTL